MLWLILILILVGVAAALLPMEPRIRNTLVIVAIIIAVVWIVIWLFGSPTVVDAPPSPRLRIE